MIDKLTFGGWLHQQRHERGASQDELAEYLGFSVSLLRKVEAGERRPSGQIAELLADFFQIPADERAAFVAFARTGQAGAGTAGPEAAEGSLRAPWRSVYVRQTNVPALLAPLIGRVRETASVQDQLRHAKTRLLTLTGPPGIGKTRLALAVAAGLVPHFADGVFFVDLAPLSDPDLVLPTVARTLGLQEAGAQPIAQVLLRHVRGQRLLLLLDNFEQVLDAAPAVVQLLEASPWLKVLVTSRETLHVRGERRFPVPPLGLPDPQHLPALTGLADAPAVALFVERAQAVDPTFALTVENAADVAAVCIGLAGVPLAIELAAARVRHLAPAALRQALRSHLQLLTGGARDLPARQRTLRAAIAWSYALLSAGEAQLFARLAVFQGGMSLAAVAAVCNQDEALVLDPREGVQALLDKSLLQQWTGGDREPRFGMLETIHEYAREMLVTQEEEGALQTAHLRYVTALAEQVEPELWGARQQEGLARLEAEYDNLRGALHWARQAGGVAILGLRLAGALGPFWYMRGYWSEGRVHLTAALAAAPGLETDRAERARALHWAGLLAIGQNAYADARALLEQSLTLARELGNAQGIAVALDGLVDVFLGQGDYPAAKVLAGQSLTRWRELGDQAGIAYALSNLGLVAYEEGDYAAARAWHEEGLPIVRKLGDKRSIAHTLNNLGNLADVQGDYGTSRALYEQSRALMRESGDQWGLGVTLRLLGWVIYQQEDYAAARALQEQSLALMREMGDTEGIAYALLNLGLVAAQQNDYGTSGARYDQSLALLREVGDTAGIAQVRNAQGSLAYQHGDYVGARAWYQQSLAPQREVGSKRWIAVSLAGLGAVATATGQPEHGAGLLSAAQALLEGIGAVLDPAERRVYEQAVTTAQAELGGAVFAQAWQTGRALPLEQAIAGALEVRTPA